MTRHVPVLLQETIEGLHLENGDTAVDATLGGGGHTLAMLERILPEGKLIAFDKDEEAASRFRDRLSDIPWANQAFQTGRLVIVSENYAQLPAVLDGVGVRQVDAICADLGFSSDQIESSERGFSFLRNGPLDMRLSRRETHTAADIVNTATEMELRTLFREYGEEPEAQSIARAIVEARKQKPFQTTRELSSLVETAYPKGRRRWDRHPATKVFQALRIAVNREFEHLEAFLSQAIERLKPGGRLAVITFHSGEDRRVKRAFREAAIGCICPSAFPVCRCGRKPLISFVSRVPVRPSEEENIRNPRARSARLRIVEKR